MHLFQFYKKHWRIPKKFYTTETRQHFNELDTKIISRVGFASDKILFLPLECKERIHPNSISSIIIQDIVGYSSSNTTNGAIDKAKKLNYPNWLVQGQLQLLEANNPELAAFGKQTTSLEFEIFRILKNEKNLFELHLNYVMNSFEIGLPPRTDHILCALKPNSIVRIAINGKMDSTLTWRSERVYSEYIYMIEYLGEVESIEFRELNHIEIEKSIPNKIAKNVDLRKILY